MQRELEMLREVEAEIQGASGVGDASEASEASVDAVGDVRWQHEMAAEEGEGHGKVCADEAMTAGCRLLISRIIQEKCRLMMQEVRAELGGMEQTAHAPSRTCAPHERSVPGSRKAMPEERQVLQPLLQTHDENGDADEQGDREEAGGVEEQRLSTSRIMLEHELIKCEQLLQSRTTQCSELEAALQAAQERVKVLEGELDGQSIGIQRVGCVYVVCTNGIGEHALVCRCLCVCVFAGGSE